MRSHVRIILVSFSAVLVLVAGTIVGTNFVTAEPASSPGPVTVTFNYNGATGGNTVASATVTSGTQANTVLPHPTKSGVAFSGWFNTQSLLNGQRVTTIEQNDAGTLIAGFVPPELAQTLNLVLPPAPCAQGGACALGDIGPGDGLVFLIDGSTRYEMAPKAWGTAGAVDPASKWCSNEITALAGIFGTAVGTGAANTALMAAPACMSGAANSATAYRGGGFTNWFLPSIDELNAMYLYKATIPAGLTATYGFESATYWSSSQIDAPNAWIHRFDNPEESGGSGDKADSLRVRPIRAF